MARRNPDATDEEVKVKAAQLFNRIAMEVNDMPEPDDLSRLDTSSYAARMKEIDVLAYAIAHARDHAEPGAIRDLEEEKIANFTNAVGHQQELHRSEIKHRMQGMGFGHYESRYPNIPDYI